MWNRVLLIDDDEARIPRLERKEWPDCSIRLHELFLRSTLHGELPSQGKPYFDSLNLLESVPFCTNFDQELKRPSRIQQIEKSLLILKNHLVNQDSTVDFVIVVNSVYGTQKVFLKTLLQHSWPFALEINGSCRIGLVKSTHAQKKVVVYNLLNQAQWISGCMVHGFTSKPIDYLVADLGIYELHGVEGRLISARIDQTNVEGARTTFIFTSDFRSDPLEIMKAASWARWIKPLVRMARRRKLLSKLQIQEANNVHAEDHSTAENKRSSISAAINLRPSISISREQDGKCQSNEIHPNITSRRNIPSQPNVLNTFELFAGAGGMGLGFLMAGNDDARYKIVFSGEINPIYARTVHLNHENLPLPIGATRESYVPKASPPIDLRTSEALELSQQLAKRAGDVHLLIGGPPCQGFSNANRNSGYLGNPNNQLVEVFLDYVERLRPRMFLMENVQGILWAPTGTGASDPMVVDHLAERMKRMGYLVFPKLLDAAWYGVPQHRNRFFLLGLHQDLGYGKDDFGSFGPFPVPTHGHGKSLDYVTVNEAIGDLPTVGNGHNEIEMPYNPTPESGSDYSRLMRLDATEGTVWDHITSQHAPYVIKRYEAVPPGGNWEDIQHMMQNYASTDGTHSNIYRRLLANEPSITIGHYRKSMLIHPSADRGLSLREAARLQSFPDWFRFCGSTKGPISLGLSHKQQQLANAVCPLMLKAIGEFLLRL